MKSFKICLILLLIMSFIVCPLKAMDINGDVLIMSGASEKVDPLGEINANIFARLLEQESYSFDTHLRVKDDSLEINTAYLKLIDTYYDFIFGKQLVAWGSGYSFNPTDVFNPKPIGAAFDPVFIKDGRTSAVYNYYMDEITRVSVIYAPDSIGEKNIESLSVTNNYNQTIGYMIKSSIFDYDVELSWVNRGKSYQADYVRDQSSFWGGSIKGSLPVMDIGVWYEGAWYKDVGKSQFSTGLEYYYGDLTYIMEYYHNDFGSYKKSDYDLNRLVVLEYLASDYLSSSIAWTVNEKLNYTFFCFSNLNDASAMYGLTSDYLYADNLEFIVSPFCFVGQKESEYGMYRDLQGSYGLMLTAKASF